MNANRTRHLLRMLLVVSLVVSPLTPGCQEPPPLRCGDDCNTAEQEPNGSFAQARAVSLSIDGAAAFAGAIDSVGDVDVYDLGLATVGDHVRVEGTRLGGGLRAILALYDDEGEFLREARPVGFDFTGSRPSIEHVIRADTPRLFATISHNVSRPSTGSYQIDVTITRDGAAVPPRPQFVVLNFDGGEFSDPIFGTTSFGAFDAADIDSAYAGFTDEIRASIRETFRQNYARFDVHLIDPDEDGPLDDGDYAQVFFGGFNGFAFGAAEEVDVYNENPGGDAVVFTEAFRPWLFPGVPSATEIGVAMGNVGAHEYGHLLGLHHVNDPRALMDEASPPATLLRDQEFKSAPLADVIFPLGRQDAADLLSVIVGPRTDGLGAKISAPALEGPLTVDFLLSVSPPITKCLTCMRRPTRTDEHDAPRIRSPR